MIHFFCVSVIRNKATEISISVFLLSEFTYLSPLVFHRDDLIQSSGPHFYGASSCRVLILDLSFFGKRSTFTLVSGHPVAYLCGNKTQKKMKYTLFAKETQNKAGRFTYTVKDENGQVISERKSNRVYVACHKNGGNYFGRVDLALKFVAQCAKDQAAWTAPSEAQVKEWRDRGIYTEEYIVRLQQEPKYPTIADIAFLEGIK